MKKPEGGRVEPLGEPKGPNIFDEPIQGENPQGTPHIPEQGASTGRFVLENEPKDQGKDKGARESAKAALERNARAALFKTGALLGEAGLTVLGGKFFKYRFRQSRLEQVDPETNGPLLHYAVSWNKYRRNEHRVRRAAFDQNYPEYAGLRELWLGRGDHAMTEEEKTRFDDLLRRRIHQDPNEPSFDKGMRAEYKALREKRISGTLNEEQKQRYEELRSMRSDSFRAMEDLVTNFSFARGGDERHSLQRRLLAAKFREYLAVRTDDDEEMYDDAQKFSKRFFQAKISSVEYSQDSLDLGLAAFAGIATSLHQKETAALIMAARTASFAGFMIYRTRVDAKKDAEAEKELRKLYAARGERLGLAADTAFQEAVKLVGHPSTRLTPEGLKHFKETRAIRASVSQRRWKAATLLVSGGLLLARTGIEAKTAFFTGAKQAVEDVLKTTEEVVASHQTQKGEAPKGESKLEEAKRALAAASHAANVAEQGAPEEALEVEADESEKPARAESLLDRIDPIGQIPLSTPDFDPEIIKDGSVTNAVQAVLEARMGKQFDKVAEALGGKDSKDYTTVWNRNQARLLVAGIIRNPRSFGMMPHLFNLSHLDKEFTQESLKKLNWDRGMSVSDVFGSNMAVEMVTSENLKKYANHDSKVKSFFENPAHATIPITSHTVRLVSEGYGEELAKAAKLPVFAPVLDVAVNGDPDIATQPLGAGAGVRTEINSKELHLEIARVLGGSLEDVRFLAEKIGAMNDKEIDDVALMTTITEQVLQMPETGDPAVRMQEAIRRINRMTDQKALRGLAKHREAGKRDMTVEEYKKVTVVPPQDETANTARTEQPAKEDLRVLTGPDGKEKVVGVIRDKAPKMPEETLSEPNE